MIISFYLDLQRDSCSGTPCLSCGTGFAGDESAEPQRVSHDCQCPARQKTLHSSWIAPSVGAFMYHTPEYVSRLVLKGQQKAHRPYLSRAARIMLDFAKCSMLKPFLRQFANACQGRR